MNKNVIFAFISGAFVGGFITYRYLSAKTPDKEEEDTSNVTYVTSPPKKIEKEEVDDKPITQPTYSISKDISESSSVTSPPKKIEKEEVDDKPITQPTYSISKDISESSREFTDYVNAAKTYKEPVSDKEGPKPYILNPVELGNSDDEEYVVSELIYYADGVLVDESDSVIEIDDIEMFIGMESLEHFGEYEPDSVAVRNERLKVDYLILRSNRYFADVENELPPSKRRKGLDD